MSTTEQVVSETPVLKADQLIAKSYSSLGKQNEDQRKILKLCKLADRMKHVSSEFRMDDP